VINDVLEVIAGALLGVVFAIATCRPTHGTCPMGWHHEGIDASGRFHCIPHLTGPDWEGPGHADLAIQPQGRIDGHLCCALHQIPVVVDERSVACARRVP